jgi:DNA-directed RNA polymerase specialized sigma24 family protein
MAALIPGSSADGADAVQDALLSAWKTLVHFETQFLFRPGFGRT